MNKQFMLCSDFAELKNEVATSVIELWKKEREAEAERAKPKSAAKRVYLTRKDVCALLSISMATLHRWVANGSLICFKAGRASRFLQSDVEALLIPVNTNNVRGYGYR